MKASERSGILSSGDHAVDTVKKLEKEVKLVLEGHKIVFWGHVGRRSLANLFLDGD